MKSFLILLAIGLAASDKLERTYLPPPGAKYAGGRPEDLDAPLELPHPNHPGIKSLEHLSGGELGFNPFNYGDKMHKTPPTNYPVKVPTTTTSFAFSQTTTFPKESYESTPLPINPVTGLPFNFDQIIKLPGLNEGNIPTFGLNLQPGSVIQSQTPQGLDVNQGYGQPIDQPLNQYPGRNVVVPGDIVQIPRLNQGLAQYPSNPISINEQQGAIPASAVSNQYPGQNMFNPGGSVPNVDSIQGIIQYPIDQTPGNPKLLSSTASAQDISLRPNYSVNNSGTQGSYDSLPINVADPNEPHLTQSHQHQEPLHVEGQSNIGSRPFGYAVDSFSTNSLIPLPERPQAAADRNAVILNYENIRYPNGYSYSYDTSNGIHADESGTVGNGTRAQGSYSYTGDDGKVYTVIYTADENGFQPRGDHLPTSPPIPEAIQKVIEQAARDEAAGIFDDGSYDEDKYGDKKYQIIVKGRQPQKPNLNQIKNKQLYGELDNRVKPIVGIIDVEEDENILLGQINKDLPNTKTRGKLIEDQNMAKQLSKEEPSKDNRNNFTIGISKILRPNDSSPEKAAPNQLNKIEMQRKESSKPITVVSRRPEDQQNQFEFGTYNEGVKNNNSPSDYPVSDYNRIIDRDFGDRITGVSSQPSANAEYNGNTGQRNQFPDQNPKENLIISYNKNNQNQNDISNGPIMLQDNSGTPFITDYLNNVNNQPNYNHKDEAGYYYQKPNTTFARTEFPTRFSTQGSTTTIRPDQAQTEPETKKPLRPFITPGVYNQNDRTDSPTPRRPFTTIGVTSPTQNTYTDYDDDYESDEDIDNDGVSLTKAPFGKNSDTSRPYQPIKTSRPQYIPTSQKTIIGQKGISPGRPVEHSNTATPGYSFRSTTPTPTLHSSRFGTTDTPQRNKPYQRRPVISQISESNRDVYNYETKPMKPTKPTSLSNRNLVPGYKTSSVVPAFGTRASTPRIQTTPSSTSTYKPPQYYSDVTEEPQSTDHTQSVSADSTHAGYHYEPPRTDNSNSGFFNSRPVSSTLSPDTYQTINSQGPFGFSNTTPVPSIPRRKGTFILTEPGSILPTGTNQENYNGPQTSTGYEYGPSIPVYSTTPSVSTFGPTPNTFSPSEIPGVPDQGYSTTYRPIQNLENGPLVDGFGRPIPSDQGTTFNGYPVSTQDPTRPPFQDSGNTGLQYDSRRPNYDQTSGPVKPLDNLPVNNYRPDFNGNIGSTTYPIPHDQPKVIGEDFSGPKQPQRYDPKTGYHY